MFENDKLKITKKMLLTDLLKSKRKLEIISVDNKPKIGVVNGLWANKLGLGGLIPIECSWVPASEKLNLVLPMVFYWFVDSFTPTLFPLLHISIYRNGETALRYSGNTDSHWATLLTR